MVDFHFMFDGTGLIIPITMLCAGVAVYLVAIGLSKNLDSYLYRPKPKIVIKEIKPMIKESLPYPKSNEAKKSGNNKNTKTDNNKNAKTGNHKNVKTRNDNIPDEKNRKRFGLF
jgi:hypothetical protein